MTTSSSISVKPDRDLETRLMKNLLETSIDDGNDAVGTSVWGK